ncbi:ComEC/Rec2 family competence protein [Arthrobacter sp. SX1312]|uniref:ComEC/Rec2 family competence protein n=1 Tax=Arthrobacter sp. SX1312 TaxID=2058896 RepID=UPI000CE4E46E|nr:ComEC/Rec2 family competence protein [Arthrobacter sp. SX1312]
MSRATGHRAALGGGSGRDLPPGATSDGAESGGAVSDGRRLPRWRGDLRLLPSAAAAWIAAATAIHGGAPGATAGGLLAGAAGLVLGCVLLLVPRGRAPTWAVVSAQALPPAAALALVLLAAGGSLARAESGPVDRAVQAGVPFTAVLRISGEPMLLPQGAFGGGDRYLVDADVIGGVLQGRRFASRTPVAVLAPEQWGGMGTGDTVRVLGTAKPSDRVGRAVAVFLPASPPTIDEAGGWLGYTDRLRTHFRELSLHDDRDGGLLPGMALGDRTGLDPVLGDAMRTTGLTHLTAVSGANCSYVVAFTFLALRLVRAPRPAAAVGAVVALAGFVMLVRPEPSVLRAAVMGSIGVVAVLSGRGRVSLTLLMLSVIVLLAADPWLSVSYAFVLSVAATLGLVLAGPRVSATLERVMPRLAAQLLAIPLTAQLFCTPVLVLIQPSLPLYSLPANVLASPAVPAITLLGMLAVLALVVAPVLAPPLIASAQWGTRWVAGVAEVLSHGPGAAVPWLPGVPGAVAAAAVSLTVLLILARREPPGATRGSTGPRRHRSPLGRSIPHRAPSPGLESAVAPVGARRRRTTAVVLAVLVLCVAAAAIVRVRAGPAAGEWDLAMCDVGQGDGMVLETTPGHALVVDAGPDPDAMDRCLDTLHVEVIDALVITHLHDDHYGGVEGVLRGRALSALYYSSGEAGLPSELTEAAAAGGVEPERLDTTTSLDLAPLRVRVLWPTAAADLTEENNASAVLDVEVPSPARPVRILLTGDLEEDAAAALLGVDPGLADRGVDILKIAHHGARNGGTAVIDAVGPRLALISAGKDNEYGHPHPGILDALGRAGITVARTDELGSFTVHVVGATVEVRPLR